MTVTATLIQLLHRINRQKTDLRGQLERCPKIIAVAEHKLKSAQDHVQQVRQKLTQMKIESDSKQLSMKQREEKIVNLEGKLNAAKENREYQALKDQIAADRQANLVLSDEILELLEGIDAEVEVLAAAEENVKNCEAERDEVVERIGEKKTTLESELERVLAELGVAEKELSGDFKREYERLVTAKGEDAMAELEGKCCGGCYQSLTPQTLERLGAGQPLICPSCGRLIYQDR